MAYFMDGMMGGYGGYGYPFMGIWFMIAWLILFLVIAYVVYRDANAHGMNGLLWGILVFIPMVGILFLIIYLVLRESGGRVAAPQGKSPVEIVKERYAKGEIGEEQYRKMREELEK